MTDIETGTELPLTPLQNDLARMEGVIKVLENWYNAKIASFTWINGDPHGFDIQAMTREDFDTIITALRFRKENRPPRDLRGPDLVHASGVYNGINIHVYGRTT
jgi:hypothetical protein